MTSRFVAMAQFVFEVCQRRIPMFGLVSNYQRRWVLLFGVGHRALTFAL